MNEFAPLLDEYLSFRRARGYGLVRAEKLLRQFAEWLDTQQPVPSLFTQAQALTWASLPGGSVSWQAMRLGVIRSFACWLEARGVPAETPSLKTLPHASHRAIPYQYSTHDIVALMRMCADVFSPFRAVTMATLTGLLAVTGMRVGEAIGLDIGDADLDSGQIRVRHAKGGKQRFVFLKPSSCRAILGYLASPLRPPAASQALFLSVAGTRLLYCNVQEGFARMVKACRLASQPGARPRLHDLRHRFATNAIAASYAPGASDSPARTLTLLATWLGHVDPANTYWYLEASPELVGIAAARLEPAASGDTP